MTSNSVEKNSSGKVGGAPSRWGRQFPAILKSKGSSPTMKLQPTYRLKPKNPFNSEKCKIVIREVVDEALEQFVYNPKNAAPNLCKSISEEIKNRVKKLGFDRYKLVCVVTIGERFLQSYNSVVKFLWDADKDGFATHVHDSPQFFLVATLYALYYE